MTGELNIAKYHHQKKGGQTVSWYSHLILILISNSLSILLAWLLWQLFLIPLKGLKLYTVCYRLFTLLPVFWLIPFYYLFCYFKYYRREGAGTGLPWHGDAFESVLLVLAILWAAGAMVCAIIFILAIYRIQHLPFSGKGATVSKAIKIAGNMDRQAWLLDSHGNEQLYPGLDFTEPVQICRTSVPVPMAPLGIRSRIFLPFCSYTEEELSMVISHEWSHIRRGDLKIRGLLLALCALFWFHPLAWRMFKDFEEWSEVACDIDVFRNKTTYVSPKKYFSLLIENAEKHPANRHKSFYENACFMSGLSVSGKRLKERIRRAACGRSGSFSTLCAIVICVLFLGLGLGLCFAGGNFLEGSFETFLNNTYMTLQEDLSPEYMKSHPYTCLEAELEQKGNIKIIVPASQPRLLETANTFYWHLFAPTPSSPPKTGWTIYLGGTAETHTSGIIDTIYFTKGTQVTICISGTSAPDTLRLGWIGPDDSVVGFSTGDVRYGRVTIPESGIYTLFAANSGDESATVSGWILYNN